MQEGVIVRFSKGRDRMANKTVKEAAPTVDSDTKISASVDADEVAFFARISAEWWNPNGPFRPLHELNPCRISYIRDLITKHHTLDNDNAKPLEGLRILDIGCGGGLICEPLTRLGATMIGVDATQKNIGVASLHAEQMGLKIDYRHTTAEDLAQTGEQFDAIINMEVVEHVADLGVYLGSCRKLLKPEGIMLVSTLNRTLKSLLLAKIGAEYILRWLPIGAHDWNKFLRPDELEAALKTAGFEMNDLAGMNYNPLTRRWKLNANDFAINYAVSAV